MPQTLDDGARKVLGVYPAHIVTRGREYAESGRVRDVEVGERLATAVVHGTKPYRVDLAVGAKVRPQCNCPAFERERVCKHIAALAWAVTHDLRTPSGERADAPEVELPPVFASVYSAAAFFARLSVYVGETIDHGVEPYVPLAEWWRRARGPKMERLRGLATAVAADVEASLTTLRRWRPPLPESSGGFAEIHAKLIAVYEKHAKNARIGALVPGPFDHRHPGFEISYYAKRRVLELRERTSRFVSEPRALAVILHFDKPGCPIQFEGSAFAQHGPIDAWDLFALRALLVALHERKAASIVELERELALPIWEQLLERLAPKGRPREREWAFVVSSMGYATYSLVPFLRPLSPSTQGRWNRDRFETLFDEDALPVERDIARLALVFAGPGLRGAQFVIGTPHGHELLRMLAGHPRVFAGDRYERSGPGTGTPLEIRAGQLTMSLDGVRGEPLRPHFRVDGQPLILPDSPLTGDRASAFRAAVGPNVIVSLEIPRALRAWFDTAMQFGDALAFPAEATPKLIAATQSMLDAGVVELPRAALGDELPYVPKPALRVEWKAADEGVAAVLEMMIQVAPEAPLVAAGHGAKLFTFEHEGRRVFVERDPRRELDIAGDGVDAVDAEVDWLEGVGRVSDTLHALGLAQWLERNPFGWAIEVKVGRAPPLRFLDDDPRGKLVVRKIGSWLRLDGSLDLGGIKISIGELLEAARHARRYVRVGDGSFLALSKEALDRLAPVATAASLAQDSSAPIVIHDAFGSLLTSLKNLVDEVDDGGIDLDAYLHRFEARDRRVRIPKLTTGKLRDYQREGVEWMLALAAWAPGCVLADDMGLGKTVQTAAVLGARAKLGPALVVAPASVSSNWVAELGRFMSSLRVHFYNEDREVTLEKLGPEDVLVVSYNLLQREGAAFQECSWSTVVLDEAQYVKNLVTQRRHVIRDVPRDFTIALTGTPLENHLGELFSIVDLVFPGLLGDSETFRDVFRRPIEAHRESERLAILASLIGPFLLRRTRESVLQELPPRQDITEYVDLSLPERKRYLALRKVCERSMNRQSKETPGQLRIALLAALTRLRQMACDVSLVEPSFGQPSTKIARTVELARQLADEGSSVLVFSQFSQFLEKVRAALADAGLRVAMLTGETPTVARKPLVDAFQAGAYDVFCVSLLAGGTGLNLTRANYVIHLDPWWNPAVEEQATSRAYRMGQMHPVTVYRLVARGTIEEAVVELHADKRELAAAVLEGKSSPKTVTSEDLLGLLRFGG